MYNEEVKQSYDEQPNPPTDEVTTMAEVETLSEDELQARSVMWACVASEVGYGDYDTEESLVDRITTIETAVAGKAATSHTHTASQVTGLAPVATTGAYDDITGKPNLSAVATSGSYNDLSDKPTAYTHPTSHPASMISGLSDVATSGSYNDLKDKPTIPTVPTSLPANGGNADTLDNMHASEFATAGHTHAQYANAVHGHAVSDIAGLSSELDGKASTTHTHDYAASTHSHTLDSVTETSAKKIMTAAERTKLEGVENGANNYTHPATHSASEITGLATVATSGSYNDLSDKPTTMTPAAHAHAQSDVTGLTAALSGKANTSHTHAQADVTGLETALSGKANTNHTHDYAASSHTHGQTEVTGLTTALSGKANASHTHAQSEITGLADALDGKASATHTHTGFAASSHTHTQAQVTGLETALSDLEDAIAGKADASHTHSTYAASSHNHTVAQITGTLPLTKGGTGATTAAAALANLGLTATAEELNYMDGVTSNVQTQLDGKAASGHNHDTAYISKALQIVADNGNVKHDYVNTDDVLAKMADLECGMHTCYCPVNTPNSPKSTEAWRFLVHKTGTSKNYGWVLALGSRGSVYSNYIDAGSWRGWKTIHDIEPVALWTGEYYMIASQTVTPTKSLSECRNGWVLLWSDYNAGEGSTNADINTTVIPKRNVTGAKWTGQSMIVPIATGLSSAAALTMAGKRIYVHDTYLAGHDINNVSPGNDVVLRAVYEF